MIDCFLPTYDVLTKDEIQKINDNSHLVKYKKGETVCRQNHPISFVLYVKSGLIKLYREYDQDKMSIVGIVGPGKFLGLMSALHSDIYENAASAVENSEIVLIKLNTFIELINENGKYDFYLLKQVSEFGFLIMEKMIKSSYTQIPGRIAGLLLYFSKEIYKNHTFTLPLSRQELADFVSATKETVSRTLTEFKNDRIIDVNDRIITLKSLDLIEKLSNLG